MGRLCLPHNRPGEVTGDLYVPILIYGPVVFAAQPVLSLSLPFPLYADSASLSSHNGVDVKYILNRRIPRRDGTESVPYRGAVRSL
jgi:hypothetical protein